MPVTTQQALTFSVFFNDVVKLLRNKIGDRCKITETTQDGVQSVTIVVHKAVIIVIKSNNEKLSPGSFLEITRKNYEPMLRKWNTNKTTMVELTDLRNLDVVLSNIVDTVCFDGSLIGPREFLGDLFMIIGEGSLGVSPGHIISYATVVGVVALREGKIADDLTESEKPWFLVECLTTAQMRFKIIFDTDRWMLVDDDKEVALSCLSVLGDGTDPCFMNAHDKELLTFLVRRFVENTS